MVAGAKAAILALKELCIKDTPAMDQVKIEEELWTKAGARIQADGKQAHPINLKWLTHSLN